MDKPTFPTIVRFTPAEIREIRDFYGLTQENFGRYFPVSMDAVRSWENGRSNPFGPSSVRLQELKAYMDQEKSARAEVISKAINGHSNKK